MQNAVSWLAIRSCWLKCPATNSLKCFFVETHPEPARNTYLLWFAFAVHNQRQIRELSHPSRSADPTRWCLGKDLRQSVIVETSPLRSNSKLGVEVENIGDLETDSIHKHQAAADKHVRIIRGWRRKHDFQFMRAGLHFLPQARWQSSVDD